MKTTEKMQTTEKMKTTPKMEMCNNVRVFHITWKKCWWLLALTVTAQLTWHRKCYQLSKPEIEFDVMEEMYVASCMHTCAEKLTF